MYGPRNKTTAKLPLTSTDKNLFERCKTDVFKVSTNYVGPIQKMRIEHDNTGKSPGWFLERVVITDLKDPKINYFCPCSKWLAKDEEDHQIVRELPAEGDGIKKPLPIVNYLVEVHTGDKRSAGGLSLNNFF